MSEHKEISSGASFGNKDLSEEATKYFCQPCSETGKKVEAEVFCPSCSEYQCTECSKVHDRFTFMKNHTFVNVKSTSDKVAFLDMDGLDRCKKHDGRLIEYFCQDDSKLCCSTCAIKEHRECKNVEDIKYVAEGSSGQSLIKTKMTELKEKCKSAANHWKDNGKKMSDQLQQLTTGIHNIRSSTCQLLCNFEENIKLESTTLAKSLRSEYSDNLARCDKIVKDIEHNLDMLDFPSANETPKQKFIVQHRLNYALENTKIEVRNERLRLEDVDIYFEFCECFEALDQIKDRLVSLNTSAEKVTIDSIFDGMPVKLEKIIGINTSCREDSSEEPLYSGMDFLHDGNLVAIDCKNQELVIFDEQLKTVNVVRLCKYPLDIITTKRDKVAITYGDQIDIFNINENHETDLIKTITDISADHLISDIEENDFLVGVVYNNCANSGGDTEEDTNDFDSVDYEDENKDANNDDIYYVEECDDDADNDDYDNDDDDDDQINAVIQTVQNEEDISYEENEQESVEVKNEIENVEESKEITRTVADDATSSHTKRSNDQMSEGTENMTDSHEESENGNDDIIDDENDVEEEQECLTDEREEDASFKICVLSASGEEENLDVDFLCYKYVSDIAYMKDVNKLALCDVTVDIYDVRTNSRAVLIDDRIKTPWGVALGPYNSIFVCCTGTGTNTICQISHTGQVMSSHEIDMENPRSICISKDKTKLAISNSSDSDRKLYLFKICQ